MRLRLRSMMAALAMTLAAGPFVHAVDLFGVQYITGSSPQASNYDLTTADGSLSESVLDWSVWGEGTDISLTANDRKSGGTLISSLTNLDPGANQQPLRAIGQFGDFGTFQWSNGSPTTSASSVQTGLQHNVDVATAPETQNVGFSFSVTGSPTETRYVYLWLGSHSGNSKLTASLNGATSLTWDLLAAQNDTQYGLVKIGFKPASTSDLLNISGVINGTVYDNGSARYFSNTFFNGVMVTTAVPEPSTYALGTIATGVMAVLARRRKARRA